MLVPFSQKTLSMNETVYTEIANHVWVLSFLFLGSSELVQVDQVLEF